MVEPVVGADDHWALTPDDHALMMNKHRAYLCGVSVTRSAMQSYVDSKEL
jgi:hypothetical protein